MGRFSPTVLPDPGFDDDDFDSALAQFLQLERLGRLDEERAEERERRREIEDAELAMRGVRRFDERPTREVAAEAPPVARGRGIGLQPDDDELDPSFRRNRARMGISGEADQASLPRLLKAARGESGGTVGAVSGRRRRPRPRHGTQGLPNPNVVHDRGQLARQLQKARNGGEGPGKPLALPGQFVPELGGFTDRPIFDPSEVRRRAGATPDFNPAASRRGAPGGGIGLQRPTSVDVPDDRFRRLTGSEGEGGFFLDESRTPESQARSQAAEQRSLLAQALEGLRTGQVTGEDLAIALERGIPGSTVDDFLLPEEEGGVSREELLAAGVPAEMVPLAMRDPTLARNLVLEGLEEDELAGRRGFTAEELRAAGVREDLIAAGVRDPVLGRSLIRDANRRTGGSGAGGGDEAFEERRDVIMDALSSSRTPISTPLRQAVIAELAMGKTKAQVLRDMRAHNFPPEEIAEVDAFLRDHKMRQLGLLGGEEGGR